MNFQLSILTTVSLFLPVALSNRVQIREAVGSIARHNVLPAQRSDNSTSSVRAQRARSSTEEQRGQAELAKAPTQEQREQVLKQARAAFEAESVSLNWFVAKNNYMFKRSKWFFNDAAESTPRMLQLVELRTAVICQLVFDQVTEPHDTKGCLHDSNDGAKRVAIPKKIPMVPGLPPFTEAQQACYALALGSVTYTSDLDFTVLCKGRKNGGIVGDNAGQQALDEVIIAERLTNAIEKLFGQSGGLVFDTNFYTNTFAYDELLDKSCSRNSVQGAAMAMYAAARGFTAAAHFAKNSECADWDNPFGIPSGDDFHANQFLDHMVSVLAGSPAWRGVSMLEFDPDKTAQDEFSRIAKFVAHQNGRKSITDRTEAYFDDLYAALKDTKNFCKNTALGLIFANEAYWVPAAIKDVVFHQVIAPDEAIKSVLMNVGYALEHVVHEFTEAHNISQEQDIMECKLGDGLVKFGKYMLRVEGTCKNYLPGPMASFSRETNKMFERAASMMKRKGLAKEEEKEYSAALPQMYRDVAREELHGPPFLPAEDCKFVQKVVDASADIVLKLLGKWPMPQGS